MLSHSHLTTYAPDSSLLLFRPADTGSPGQDFCIHMSRNQHRRIDLEGTMLVGDNVIVRIEPDLGSAEDVESDAKIVTVRYAERVMGNNADAVEFVRCVKLIAGEDARGIDLQTVASYYYGQAKTRPAGEVLKEMALLAMQLSSVTSTEESRLFGELVESESGDLGESCNCAEYRERSLEEGSFRCGHIIAAARDARRLDVEGPFTESDRRAAFMDKAAQVLGEDERFDIYREEMRAKSIYRRNGHAQGFAYEADAPFLAHLHELAARGPEAGQDAGAFDAHIESLFDSYERVSEQYDEGHVVSLHMSDNERVVVVGTLDDDVDENYLPSDARHLAAGLRKAFVGGAGAQAARKLIAEVKYARLAQRARRDRSAQLALSLADEPGPASSFSASPLSEAEMGEYMDAATSVIYDRRVKRTARAAYFTADGPKANRLGRPGFYTATYTIMVNPDAETRSYVMQVLEKLLAQMKGDFHLRGQRGCPAYREFHRRIRTATDTAVVAATIKEAFGAKERGEVSLSLFTALVTASKTQRWALESRPLSRVALRLIDEVRAASPSKLMFLRWALYGTNKPDHVVHTLPRQEKARVWEVLKERTGLATPVSTN